MIVMFGFLFIFFQEFWKIWNFRKNVYDNNILE
jgi:hypothetical protein